MADPLGTAKVGSLVAAAMETTGLGLQSEMLDFVNGQSGQTLAGLLFLFGIATAVVTLAAGGNYRWGRYLMVGPPLFFFLTQVRIGSNGTEWQFADQAFPKQLREKMLRGVSDFENGQLGGKDVSMFFQFWNVFMSELTQILITQLNLTKDGSHLSFITKIERYMSFWIADRITDPNMRLLISMALVPNCADYFQLKKLLADPAVPDPVKEYYKPIIAEREEEWAFTMLDIKDQSQNELYKWLQGQGFVPDAKYSCDQLWQKLVETLRKQITEVIDQELKARLAPGQQEEHVRNAFYKKILTETSRATGQVKLFTSGSQLEGAAEFQDGLLRAVDWVVARSLWLQIWDRHRFADSFEFEGHPMTRSSGSGEQRLVTDEVAETAAAIHQFNRTEVYQFKGDFVNAALSLPHFQGVMLLLLAASYPFFAMMVVIPGRAGAILTWMGLWAWVKLWDFGFAVVMMVDNILYAMFPRAPNLTGAETADPGKAWMRILEVDPNYSAAVYYNIIAACMFAVPLVTALFVKGGASELTGLVHGSWQQYSNRLAGSAATFARSLQAQSYARRFEEEKFEVGKRAGEAFRSGDKVKAWNEEHGQWGLLKGVSSSNLKDRAIGLATKYGHGKAALTALGNYSNAQIQAYATERQAMLERMTETGVVAAAQRAAYNYSIGPSGDYAAQAAVRARYYSHMFMHEHPGKYELNHDFSKQFFNKEAVVNAQGNSIQGAVQNFFKNFLLGGAGR